VSRKVIEVNPKFQPDGQRFAVKQYAKDKEYRRFKLSQQITAKIHAHVTANGLGDDDLPSPTTHRPSPGHAVLTCLLLLRRG
jgi:hypothetical protein